MARIKDNVLHPITEMKARKRKASPGIIDLTCPTQKRSRSASGKDVIVVDDAENLQPVIVDGARGSGRSPSVEIQEERSPANGDIMKCALSWSRFSMKQIRSAPAYLPVEFQLNFAHRKKDKYQILHFPLTAPLTSAEKSQRKVVTSLKL